MLTLAPLLDSFPEWRPLVHEVRADDGSSFETLEVQAPAGANVEHGLIIEIARNEITVSFDAYHAHFDEWVGDGAQLGALDFITEIVAEHVGVLSWWYGERWCGSALIDAGQKPKLPDWVGTETINRMRMRSWKGTLNADIQV